ncbi:hypothetical protein HDU97_003969 [Phlyctochytrium planicorne]|nr:hypothetical protein HDU97_003969 [Phlyctochytrium planicorne]
MRAHLVALLIAIHATLISAQGQNCLSLSGSKLCSSWEKFSIFLDPSANNRPFSTVEQLDSYLSGLVTDLTGFQNSYGCPGYTEFSLRYEVSTFCGYYVQVGTSQECNPPGGPPTLCKTTGNGFLDTYKNIFGNTTICLANPSSDQQKERNTILDNFGRFVDSLTDSSTCVANVPSEAVNCGFGDSNQLAINFCNATPQSCCRAVSGVTLSASTATDPATSTTTIASKTVDITTQPPTTTTSDTSPTQSSTNSEDQIFGINKTIVIGGGIGLGVLIIGVVVGFILCCIRRGRKSAKPIQPGANAGYVGSPNGSFRNPDLGYASQDPYGGPKLQGGQQQMASLNQVEINSGPSMMETVAPVVQNAGAGSGAGAALAVASAAGSAPAGVAPNQVAETMEAIFNYVPNLSDEIYLYVGDPVIVKCQFDDGWGYGFNMTTKQEGTFPIACVAPYNDSGEVPSNPPVHVDEKDYDPKRASFSIRQRGSSMFGPPAGFRETMTTNA